MEETTRSAQTAVGIILLFLAVLTAVTNGCMLYVVKRDPLKCFKKPTNMFAVSLTILHLSAGLVVYPYLGIVSILQGENLKNIPEIVTNLGTAMSNFVISMVTLLMFALSLERFTSSSYPHLNRKWITNRRVVLFSWALGLLCALASLALILPGIEYPVYYFVYLHVLILPSLLGVCIVSIATFWTMRNQVRISPIISMQFPMTQDLVKEAMKRNAQRKRSYVATACVVFPPLFVPLAVYYVAKLLNMTCSECSEQNWFILLDKLCVPFVLLYSFLFPILIIVKVPEYSRSFRRILRME